MLPHDWLAFRLTGERTTDRGDASGTGYWSPPEGRWRLDLLGIVDGDLDWARALPEVLGPEDALGTGDNMAGALGIGLAPGDVAISIGTSGTVYAVSDRPAADATGAVAGFADATGRFLPLVCTLNATRVTDAFARLLGLDRERFHAAALEAPRGAGGVTLLPYLDGERTPNRPDATGTIGGLRADVSREQLARAAVEGVACGLLDGLDALRTAGVDVDGRRLVLLGGGARSAAYRRVLADLSGRTLTVAPDAEEVALGACVQAASRLHGRPASEVQRAWGLGSGDVVEPDAAAADVASEIRARYAALRDGG
jgi:xylulokinase